jgi:hypothetical protein
MPVTKPKKTKVRLTHNCGKPGCEGMPGDVIEVTPANRDWLLKHKGAVVVDEGLEPDAEAKTPAN